MAPSVDVELSRRLGGEIRGSSPSAAYLALVAEAQDSTDLGNGDALHWAFHALGRALAADDPVGACEAYEQAMAHAREVGSRFNAGLDLVEWVDVKRRLGDLSMARVGAQDLLGLVAVCGTRAQLSQALRQAGLVLAATGNSEVAALALLARRDLPAMPTGVDTQAADEQVVAELRREIGDAWPRVRVRAMAVSEPALIELCRSALATAGGGTPDGGGA